jgi:hypothetical protein
VAKKNKNSSHSRLSQHRRNKKTLSPPLRQISQLNLVSWRESVAPDLLWAVALASHLDREEYLALFREVAEACRQLGPDRAKGIKHSELARTDQEAFDFITAPLLAHKGAKDVLRSIVIFDGLPDRNYWLQHIFEERPQVAATVLATAIANVTDHQSEQATDCRWLRLLVTILLEKISFPPSMVEQVREVFEYPNKGDLRSVRPFVRATEMSMAGLEADESSWPVAFWRECWERTQCILPARVSAEPIETKSLTEESTRIYSDLMAHFIGSSEDTALDPRKDGAFGLALYSVSLYVLALQSRSHWRADGRLILRTLAECLLTLKFLVQEDKAELWLKFRQHGNGQTKLTFLKMLDLEESNLPSYIKIEDLEFLANEDEWHEFKNIELGNWAGIDLRKMSEEVGLKEVYDKYYLWPSSFVHGQWGAIRDSVFTLCLNPLHRFHRIPSPPRINMHSMLADARSVINLTLEQLDAAYPDFPGRFLSGDRVTRRRTGESGDTNP